MRVICVYFGPLGGERVASVHAFAEACYSLSPDIALRKQEAVFLDISRCRKLYREGTALRRVEVFLRRFRLEGARIAIADDVPTALALARTGLRERLQLPLAELSAYVDPFGRELMTAAAIARMVETLGALGLRTLGNFAALPVRDLVARAGAPAEIAWRHLRDPRSVQAIPWPRWKMPEKVLEAAEFLEHERCFGLEPLLFKSRELMERVLSRMRGRGLRVSALKLTVEQEKLSIVASRTREWVFEFPLPQSSLSGIVTILRERLQRDFDRLPLQAALEAMSFEVLETAPALGAQRNLFHERDEKLEALHSLVGRVAEKLGATQIFQAETTESYLPERSWQRRPVAALALTNGRAELSSVGGEKRPRFSLPYGPRPLRLYPRPRILHRVGRFLMEGGKRWRIREVFGPERIKGEWWRAEGFEPRDYYRIETENGDTLWIFRDGNGGLFLHGVFE